MKTKNQGIKIILAIESSCDETAAAIVEVNRSPSIDHRTRQNTVNGEQFTVNILSNIVASQIDIHKQYGGVFPEIASRAHSEKIIPVVEEALKQGLGKSEKGKENFTLYPSPYTLIDKVDLIAVTKGPGLIGSLLIGVNFAKTLAFTTKKPIIGVNHLMGHIYSNWQTDYGKQTTAKNAVDGSQSAVSLPKFPTLVLIVSGGHTGLYLMKSHSEIKTLGETLDDAAGEAFDKVAKLLELGYPGGPAISKAATEGDSTAFNFPRAMLDRKDYNFSFSGIKTAVLNESKKHKLDTKTKNNMAASFQQAVCDILIGKTIQAAKEFEPKSICLCGGVSANKELREQLKEAVEKFSSSLSRTVSYHVPDFSLTTDNAAMIGLAAAYHLDQITSWDKVNADSNLKL